MNRISNPSEQKKNLVQITKLVLVGSASPIEFGGELVEGVGSCERGGGGGGVDEKHEQQLWDAPHIFLSSLLIRNERDFEGFEKPVHF